MSITWFSPVHNLLRLEGASDQSGILDVSSYVPATATGIVLTVERGYLYTPSSAQAVSLRVMPNGYNLSNPLDRAKLQLVAGGGISDVDVVADDVTMPLYGGVLKFFYGLQSTDPSVTNKEAIIDLWGYWN